MAPRTGRKAQSKGSETPLRRSKRGKQDDAVDVEEKKISKPDELNTDADSINSPPKVLRRSRRSNNEEGAAEPQQGPNVPGESVQADHNLGDGVGTRFVSDVREPAEQESVMLERALHAQFDDDGTFDPAVICMDRFRKPNIFERGRIWITEASSLEIGNLILSARNALRALARTVWPIEVKAFSVAFVLLVVWNILWPATLTAWTLLHVDVDLAIDSTCERAYAQAFCREACKLNWTSSTFPICCSGRGSDIPHASKEVPSSKSSGPTILERLDGHKESCEKYQAILFPSIKADLEATTPYKIRLLDNYKKLCRSLNHLPEELMSYYLQVMGNATTISKYAHDAKNHTQETTANLPSRKLKSETKALQKYFSGAIPIEGDTLASLKRVRGRLQWTFEKLSFDSNNLKRDLKDIRAQTLEKKSTVITQLQRKGKMGVQTDHEPAQVQRYTKAIEGLDEWYGETSALELLLMHIDLDVENLQRLVNGFVEKGLSTQVGQRFGKADVPEMQLLLTGIREDARRIHEVARRSNVMRGWKQRPESGRVMDGLREGVYEGGTGERLAPWI